MPISVEYTGDRLLSLGLWQRKFMIEGVGMFGLALHVQQGVVVALQEYSEAVGVEAKAGIRRGSTGCPDGHSAGQATGVRGAAPS